MINLHVQLALSLRRILLTHIELARLITCEVVIVESVLCKVWMTIDLTISCNEQKHLIAIGTARHLRLVAKLVEQELLHHNSGVLISAECLRGFTNEEEYTPIVEVELLLHLTTIVYQRLIIGLTHCLVSISNGVLTHIAYRTNTFQRLVDIHLLSTEVHHLLV